MKERILKFLESERISPAEFADKIGVQRSSMSHILNGRNYPSASFIQKMLLAYPLLNSRWLMIGVGTMNLESNDLKEIPDFKPPVSQIKSVINKTTDINPDSRSTGEKIFENETVDDNKVKNEQLDKDKGSNIGEFVNHSDPIMLNQNDIQVINENQRGDKEEHLFNPSAKIPPIQSGEKEIEQVFLFYSDKTFKVYRPC